MAVVLCDTILPFDAPNRVQAKTLTCTLPLDAGHTVALVEEIAGMVGVDELLLTLREEEPVRITRAQVPTCIPLQHSALCASGLGFELS